MRKWEYLTCYANIWPYPEEASPSNIWEGKNPVSELLNDYGKAGWELVSTTDALERYIVYTFKRPIEE